MAFSHHHCYQYCQISIRTSPKYSHLKGLEKTEKLLVQLTGCRFLTSPKTESHRHHVQQIFGHGMA